MQRNAMCVADERQSAEIPRIADPDMPASSGRAKRNTPGIHQVFVEYGVRVKPSPVGHQNFFAEDIAIGGSNKRRTAGNQKAQRKYCDTNRSCIFNRTFLHLMGCSGRSLRFHYCAATFLSQAHSQNLLNSSTKLSRAPASISATVVLAHCRRGL